jgi:hypothetical protein
MPGFGKVFFFHESNPVQGYSTVAAGAHAAFVAADVGLIALATLMLFSISAIIGPAIAAVFAMFAIWARRQH